jgi:hypothetical protein
MIDSFANPPAVVRAKNIAGVDFFNGIYCVYLDPSIDLNKVVAVVGGSAISPLVLSASPGACSNSGKTGIQVNAYNLNGSFATGDFSIAVFGG